MNSIELQPVKIKKLSSMVEDSIKNLIVTGQLKSGDRLPTEKELSGKFGVSLITIREALRGLEALGVIEKKRGKDGGIFIHSNSNSIKEAILTFFSSKEFSLKDIDEVRENLQPFCCRLAASRISDDQMKALEQNVEDSESKLDRYERQFTEEAYHEIEDRNSEFHRLIGAATCNPILTLTVDYVEDFLKSYKEIKGIPDIEECTKIIGHHRQIVDSLKERNPAKAERVMMNHIKGMGDYFLQKENEQAKK